MRTVVRWSIFAVTVLVAIGANAQTWETDPAFGAKRNAFGPGIHMDATGRPYKDNPGAGGPALEPVHPNVYGPGVGMDATGRPVRPKYDTDLEDSPEDDD